MMRLTLITQDEPFYLPAALDAICTARQDEIVALIVLPAFNEKLTDTARRLYGLYGPLDFLRLSARFSWAKIANLFNRVFPLTRPFSAADVARRHKIPVYPISKINAADTISFLSNTIRPDLIISIAASQIFRSAVLRLPTHGCINLHSAPLPRYQGMMPNFWAMVNGEKETAVTVHYMVEKIDAGDIIIQRSVPITPSDSLHDLMVRSKQIGAQAMLDAISQIENGTVETRPLEATQATYFSFPTKADAQRLRAQGRRLL
jgi:methionyl-tRNA formyltransferase